MSQSSTLFIGMDVHNDSLAGAYVAQEHGAAVMSPGTIGPRQWDIDPPTRKMQSQANHLIFVYEAGPWGSWRYRSLTQNGYDCWVGAPSLILKKPGDRVTTDRRDAVHLARLARSGALPAVSVPKVADAAMRALARARAAAISARKEATCRLTAFWLRHASRSVGRAPMCPAHLRWLSAVVCPTLAQPIVLHESVRTVHEPTERLQRLAQALPEQDKAWRWHAVVEALQALRSVPCTVAVTMVAASGALTRCEHIRERRKFLGLIPSVYPSAERRRPGSLPKAGHPQARRALGEGAWA